MLLDLQDILESFEYVFEKFQSNKITSSLVYPAICFLKNKLNDFSPKSTKVNGLLITLKKELSYRFDDLVQKDVFLMATFLDPTEGIDSFHYNDRARAIAFLKDNLKKLQPNNSQKEAAKHSSSKKASRFLKFTDPSENNSSSSEVRNTENDCIDNMIKDFIRFTNGNAYDCALKFWKVNQATWPFLAELAKKVLGVPATSASVERIFNLSDHVFSNKRKRLGIKLFERLVFLKLNEKFL